MQTKLVSLMKYGCWEIDECLIKCIYFRQSQRTEKITRLDSAEYIAPAVFLLGNFVILFNCCYEEGTASDTLYLPMYILNNIILFPLLHISLSLSPARSLSLSLARSLSLALSLSLSLSLSLARSTSRSLFHSLSLSLSLSLSVNY